MRVFIMSSGIALCILVITLVTSISLGAKEQVNDLLQKFGPKSIVILAGGKRQPGQPFEKSTTLTLKDVETIRSQINGIESISPAFNSTMNAKYKDQNIDTTVSGSNASWPDTWDWNVIEGRFFTHNEDFHVRRVAVLGQTVVKDLFLGENPIGKTIRIENTPFVVIGVLSPEGTSPHGNDRDNRIIIPLNTMLKRMVNETYLSSIRIKFEKQSYIASSVPEISNILRRNHKIFNGLPDDFTIVTPDQIIKFLNNINLTMNIFLVAAILISLIIGSVVVSNIMQASISEREKEIALRRAFGATRFQITIQVFLEIFVISLVGAFFGTIFGTICSVVLHKFTGIPTSISLLLFLIAFCFATLIALVSGIRPALKASSFDPAIILQR
ncbi:ABC transporter permease [Thermodesulfobium narugense]|uniref:ABC transporter permease n=1 Tax=Thermodesulfobium narugense TaxID=184064 RepID=UPI001FE0AD22|nr:ABC transporter permease [Thermodesulfobium narugense]